jgi:hypothetical protein
VDCSQLILDGHFPSGSRVAVVLYTSACQGITPRSDINGTESRLLGTIVPGSLIAGSNAERTVTVDGFESEFVGRRQTGPRDAFPSGDTRIAARRRPG